MPILTMAAIEGAIRDSWSVETCDPIDVENWSAANPSRGQCGATALVVRELLGGLLLEAEVLFDSGEHQGFHYWNRLPGLDLDLTADQFYPNEIVQPPHVVDGPPTFPWVVADQFVVLRDRVYAALGLERDRPVAP
jgi:hypothetical protein